MWEGLGGRVGLVKQNLSSRGSQTGRQFTSPTGEDCTRAVEFHWSYWKFMFLDLKINFGGLIIIVLTT